MAVGVWHQLIGILKADIGKNTWDIGEINSNFYSAWIFILLYSLLIRVPLV